MTVSVAANSIGISFFLWDIRFLPFIAPLFGKNSKKFCGYEWLSILWWGIFRDQGNLEGYQFAMQSLTRSNRVSQCRDCKNDWFGQELLGEQRVNL